MPDDRGDFQQDLAAVRQSLDVDSILQALGQSQRSPAAPERAAVKSVSHARPLAGGASPRTARRPRSVRSQPPVPEPRRGLQNITTRLTPETVDLLGRAALQQQLKKVTPDTRQAIVEEAVRQWARRQGYLRSGTEPQEALDPPPEPGEPTPLSLAE